VASGAGWENPHCSSTVTIKVMPKSTAAFISIDPVMEGVMKGLLLWMGLVSVLL
jgi:hypothetical protein